MEEKFRGHSGGSGGEMSTTHNMTLEIIPDLLENAGVRYTLVVLHAIASVLAATGNCFLIVFILRHWKETHRNVTAILILNLAACDFVNVVVHQPMKLVDILAYHEDNLTYCQVSGFFTAFFSGVAFMLIVAIGTERFLIICYPFRAKRFLTFRNTIIVMVSTWAGVAITVLPIPIGLVYVRPVQLKSGVAKFCLVDLTVTSSFRPDVYFMFLFILFFIIPVVIITVCYVRIFRELHSNFPGNTQSNDSAKRILLQRKSLAKVMVSIAIIFVVSSGPYWIVQVVALCGYQIKKNPIFTLLFVDFLTLISPVMNPIVYSVRFRTFRKGVTHGGSIYTALRQISLNRTSTMRSSETPLTSGSYRDAVEFTDNDTDKDLSAIIEAPFKDKKPKRISFLDSSKPKTPVITDKCPEKVPLELDQGKKSVPLSLVMDEKPKKRPPVVDENPIGVPIVFNQKTTPTKQLGPKEEPFYSQIKKAPVTRNQTSRKPPALDNSNNLPKTDLGNKLLVPPPRGSNQRTNHTTPIIQQKTEVIPDQKPKNPVRTEQILRNAPPRNENKSRPASLPVEQHPRKLSSVNNSTSKPMPLANSNNDHRINRPSVNDETYKRVPQSNGTQQTAPSEVDKVKIRQKIHSPNDKSRYSVTSV